MSLRVLKYLLVYSLPIAAAISFQFREIWTFSAIIYGFGIIPAIELFIGTDKSLLSDAEKEVVARDKIYDWLLYGVVPVIIGMLVWFLVSIQDPSLLWWEIIGRISAMGLLCGVMGINVAHELGHRQKVAEKLLAKSLLLVAQYLHFYVEHNQGHHRNVGTPGDPSSAKMNESIYAFWIRTVLFSYVSAWRIQNQHRRRKKFGFFSLKNEMFWYAVLQLTLMSLIYLIGGAYTVRCYLAAATVGILLLETVNYIEHYGLRRSKVSEHRFEDVLPIHSWNSDHIIGRLMLFELTRHSDHHYNAQKKFQTLESSQIAPQLPAGYPGMMLFSLFSPLFFIVMNKKVRKLRS